MTRRFPDRPVDLPDLLDRPVVVSLADLGSDQQQIVKSLLRGLAINVEDGLDKTD